jgi:hypothetical protein
MNLFERLKLRLGERNLSKYFVGSEQEDELVQFIADGIERLAAGRPIAVKEELVVEQPSRSIQIPGRIKKVSQVWVNGRQLRELKEFDVYAGDRFGYVFQFDIERPYVYPGEFEREAFGDWRADVQRRVIEFRSEVVGQVTICGSGVPTEQELSARDAGMVLKYALSEALKYVLPKMLATHDIDVEGMTVKERISEYSEEAKKLANEFEAYAKVPYAVVVR